MRRSIQLTSLIVTLSMPVLASAADISANPSDYRSKLTALRAGDTLRLAPGTYTQGLPINGKHGTPTARITIAGATTGGVSVFLARSGYNTVSLTNSSYLTIRGLVLDGRGIEASAVKAEKPSTSVHNIIIEGLTIKNHNASQQTVGISTKCAAWDWVIRRNRIEGAGTGLYLGDSDGSAPFIRGIIENNLVLNTRGYGMQIKHQRPRVYVSGMPTGASSTIIRNNVFTKWTGSITGYDARPNLLLGHWPLSGSGTTDRYQVYGNFFYQNMSAQPLVQAEGNVSLHDNVLVNTYSGGGITIRPHNDVPRAINIYNNTIYSTGRGVYMSGANTSYRQYIVANAIFAGTPISASTGIIRDNFSTAFANATTHVLNASTTLGSMNFYPRLGRLTGTTVDLSPFSADLERTMDFNRRARGATYRGAYQGGLASNPGWQLQAAIKP